MGIPGFASHIREYGCVKIIGTKPSSSNPISAIVDGPALAHHVYQEHMKQSSQRTDTIGSDYRYTQLGNAFVAWLERLEEFGFRIDGIYFDGALPSYKVPTRIDRSRKYLDNLAGYKQLHDAAQNTSYGARSRKRRRRDPQAASGDLKPAPRGLPPPPFLIVAILEDLATTRFQSQTSAVPGEADTFCAAAALALARRRPGQAITIFTNDSDLIVYDSGPQTRVVLISSINELDRDDGQKELEGLEHWPAELACRGSSQLKDLIKPAYAMQDVKVTFQEALARKDPDNRDPNFIAFAEEFSTVKALKQLSSLRAHSIHGPSPLLLDPRVSELSCAAAQPGSTKSVDLFPPVLLEDPSRSTAWKIGSSFRQTAVSILFHHRKMVGCAGVEHRKSGSQFRPLEVSILSREEIDQSLSAWIEYIKEQLEKTSGLRRSASRWMYVIVQFILSELFHESKPLPSIKDLEAATRSTDITSWAVAHLMAMLQAEYYSLRMLVQLTLLMDRANLRQVCDPGSDPSGTFLPDLKSPEVEFLHIMEGYPTVTEFFEDVSRENDAHWKDHLEKSLGEFKNFER